MSQHTEVTAPVFIKAKDIMGDHKITEYEMCSEVAKQIGTVAIQGCQLIRGLWRIYVRNREKRIKLVTEMLTFKQQKVAVFADNPFKKTQDTAQETTTKITVKDMPISKGNEVIKRFMEANGVKIKNLIYGKIRDPVTKQLLDWLNGDRIIYAEELTAPLPRWASIDGTTVRIFHDKQIEGEKLCTKCFKTDHTRRQCTNQQHCRCCKKVGHNMGDKECEATIQKPHSNIICVNGEEDPLSNFYHCGTENRLF